MPLSKSKLKLIQALKLSKYRQKYNKILVEGLKICLDILQLYPNQVEDIYVEEKWAELNFSQLQNHQFEAISLKEMKLITQLSSPSPMVLICKKPMPSLPVKLDIGRGAIYLDGVRDPGNMGTIIRTADWFGIKEFWCSTDCVDLYNQKVIQASMGSVFEVVPKVVSHQNLLDLTVGNNLIVSDMKGLSIQDFKWPKNPVIVVGNEGRGVSPVILEKAGQRLAIPGADTRNAESLNVSIATGIILSYLPM